MADVPTTPTAGKGHGFLCPACKVDLVMGERQGVEIDYCAQCRGIWLDRGELDKIIERSLRTEAPSQPCPPRAAPANPFDEPPAPALRQGQPYPTQYGNDGGHGSGHGGHGGGHGHGRRHG